MLMQYLKDNRHFFQNAVFRKLDSYPIVMHEDSNSSLGYINPTFLQILLSVAPAVCVSSCKGSIRQMTFVVFCVLAPHLKIEKQIASSDLQKFYSKN